MASEYGVQAWCNNETLAKVFVSSDYAMDSDMVNHRQHHGGGNSEMAAEVNLHINLPNSPDEKEKFLDFIYLTQINQAMCIRSQSEHYRRHQSKLLPDGRGLTMGALYWQLNDIWQAPTWASIDYSGTWKMLHYYAKSFFGSTLISPYYLDDNTIDVYIVIDEIAIKHVRDPVNGTITMQPMVQASDYTGSEISSKDASDYLQNAVRATAGYLKVEIYQYISLNPLFSWNVSYRLTTTAESVFQKSVNDLLTESACPGKDKCILHLTTSDSVGSPISSTWFALAYPKYSVLPPAKVQITSVVKLDQFIFEIEISSDVVALYTWLSTDTILGHFSDNGFPIFSVTQKVFFYAADDVSVTQLTSQLRVRSITDVKNNSTNNQVVG
ncbi:hypothetical protein Btru_035125 [Bulinus truncatus]|nr:hypothetical protein Btru_035125 [Bulinus truncatus]